jgi:SynChlorMet cassette radical SAM/SPASM protein ScmE
LKNYYSAPNDVCLAVTKRCNLSCRHCCTGVDSWSHDDELTLDEIRGILDELKTAKVFRIQVFGGEPFARKDIFKILALIKERRFGISLNTNCTLITAKIASELREFSPFGVMTSLDGSSAKIHDAVRGRGAFEKTVRGIQALLNAGIPVAAEAVVTKKNILDLPNIAEKAKELNLRMIDFVPVFYCGQAKCFQSELAPDQETYMAGGKIAEELIRRFPRFAKGAFLDGYLMIENFKKMKKGKNQKTANFHLCGAGRTTAGIRSDGEVVPCSALWDMPIGSLRKSSFREIWENSKVLKQFRSLDRYSLDTIEECRACDYKYWCTGNCRASAYHYSSNLTGFDPGCFYYIQNLPKIAY